MDTKRVNLETGSGSVRPSVAVVTGAASGIGLSCCRRLAERGHAVVAVDRASPDEVCAEIAAVGGTAVPVAGDVTDIATYQLAIEAAAKLGELDLAVLNAGIRGDTGDIVEMPLAAYDALVDVNVNGVFLGLRALLGTWAGRHGSVVVTASGGGLVGVPHDPVYALTKHAVVGLVRSLGLREDLGHVRINCICPGGVDTPLLPEFRRRGRELISADVVADSIIHILGTDDSGQAWVLTPSVFERFMFGQPPSF